MTEETLFNEALAKPPAERPAFLQQACAGQRVAVEKLLAAYEASGSFLKRPADFEATGAHTPRPEYARYSPIPQKNLQTHLEFPEPLGYLFLTRCHWSRMPIRNSLIVTFCDAPAMTCRKS